MNMNTSTVEYFKAMSSESGIPYQVLINLYLDECVKEKKKIQFVQFFALGFIVVRTTIVYISKSALLNTV